MKEKGFVVSLKENIAVVRVQRQAASEGCCHFDTTENVFINAENICKASVNDWVYIESDGGKRILIQIGLSFFSFIIGIVAGDYIVGKLLGVINGREVGSIAVGIAFALFAYLIIKFKNRDIKSTLPVVSEIINN